MRSFCLPKTMLNATKGARIAQSVEALYFTTELHTSSVRVRVQPGTKYLYGKIIRRNVCGLAVAFRSRWFHMHIPGGFTGISRERRDMSWLSSTSGRLRIILSNDGDAVQFR